VGILLSAAGTYFTAKDIIALGLPTWIWYLIGLVILSTSFDLPPTVVPLLKLELPP